MGKTMEKKREPQQQPQQPPADGATCTDSAIGCDEAYCGITDFARAHCSGTCRNFLDECCQMAGVPDPSRACANTADNCAMNPNVCSDDVLAVCGCPRKCGRCSDHTTNIMQGWCRNIL
ncbi:hypothetical protein niasHT_010715 [Heterodera trifolii]|uniref:ShKT domain-containing protein n=1 Tax=Heterodera trifolii TaxID=157864 RepID=A0ABD2L6C1_9BILA